MKISGGVGNVEIKDNVVTKKYKFQTIDTESVFQYFVSDICFLSIIHENELFYKFYGITHIEDEYSFKMPYLGEWVCQTDDYLKVFKSILQQIQLLHDNHIVHCDIKTTNILMDENNNVHVIDFSHSKIADKRMNLPYCNKLLQTYIIMAPESYDKRHQISSKVDVWSLGCVLYELITGKNLFHEGDMKNIIEQQKEKKHISRIKKNIPNKTDRIILYHMLRLDPDKRPTVKDIITYYETPNNTLNITVLQPTTEKFRIRKTYVDRVSKKINDLPYILEKKYVIASAEILTNILITEDDFYENYKNLSTHKCIKYIMCICKNMNILDLFKGWYI